MIRGKSIYHVKQNEGKLYCFDSIKGYYNDLTKKVTNDAEHKNSTEPFLLPGQKHLFPISVFQYGLGAYDIYLETKDELMLKKVVSHANWAIENQNEDGGWICFYNKDNKDAFSAMAQGEGISLLLRAFQITNNIALLKAAEKAALFMLTSIENGGTSRVNDEDLFLYEFTNKPLVFNGWMFAIFGLMDLDIVCGHKAIKEALNKTINSFTKILPHMDNGYWSMYRLDKTIASPFYHNLHIAQLSVLYKYTKNKIFLHYLEKFSEYQKNPFCKTRAFIKKAIQKIIS